MSNAIEKQRIDQKTRDEIIKCTNEERDKLEKVKKESFKSRKNKT